MMKIGEDIVKYNILPRLPVKSLMRLQCVSRRWHNLISNDTCFIYLQSWGPSSSSSGGGFLFMEDFDESPTLVSNDPLSVVIPSGFFSAQGEEFWGRTVASSCGLLCVKCYGDYTPICRVHIGNPILNPILKDWLRLDVPQPKGYAANLIFGLAVNPGKTSDHVRYSLVVLDRKQVSFSYDGDINVEYYYADLIKFGFFVFSSTTQQWKVSKETIMLPLLSVFDKVAAYVNGCLYWKFDAHDGSSHSFLWFDPKEELSGFQQLPPGTGSGRIGEWGDKLSYITITGKEIQIWSMDQSLCWSKKRSVYSAKILKGLKLLTCHMEPRKRINLKKLMRLMPFQGGDSFSFHLDNNLFCYDMVTEEVSKQADSLDPYSWFPYKNSLLHLPLPKPKPKPEPESLNCKRSRH